MGLYEVRHAMEAHVKLRARLDLPIALNLGESRLGVTEPVETIANLDKYKTGSIIVEPLVFVYRVNLIKKIFLASEVSKYSDKTLRGVLRMIHVKEERHKVDLLAKLDLEISSMINFRELIMKFHRICSSDRFRDVRYSINTSRGKERNPNRQFHHQSSSSSSTSKSHHLLTSGFQLAKEPPSQQDPFFLFQSFELCLPSELVIEMVIYG
ncbi:hypothetical protein L6452_42187 [Arctium lappa]|uniref:Uncharacterized protein n=1 Tax=Arctium lappa TaxID=4217 RepID=A0ACB8XI95_ARCLA|nr:hypothetical protein L6452_42187 [Arctium lappa]